MSELNDGGPAFPVECYYANPSEELPLRGLQTGNSSGWELGLSMRDYFAAKAMQALLTNRESWIDSNVAVQAYDVADAMLKARQQ